LRHRPPTSSARPLVVDFRLQVQFWCARHFQTLVRETLSNFGPPIGGCCPPPSAWLALAAPPRVCAPLAFVQRVLRTNVLCKQRRNTVHSCVPTDAVCPTDGTRHNNSWGCTIKAAPAAVAAGHSLVTARWLGWHCSGSGAPDASACNNTVYDRCQEEERTRVQEVSLQQKVSRGVCVTLTAVTLGSVCV
jgi:hypothetical protein